MPIVDDWWVGVDLFEPSQAEGTMYGFDDAVQNGDSNADQVCETDTDADQTERWYEAAVDDWGSRVSSRMRKERCVLIGCKCSEATAIQAKFSRWKNERGRKVDGRTGEAVKMDADSTAT